jgi:hypothetical protein
MATFVSWQAMPLRSFGTGAVVGGRLQAAAPIALEQVLTGQAANDVGPFELLGPGDVARLAPGVISRRHPRPGAVDAEQTKRALVEFGKDQLDLPWRYSPVVAAGARVRPWLVLVVGEPEDLALVAGGKVLLSVALQGAHPLPDSAPTARGTSADWAHVHEVEDEAFARILSPVVLKPTTGYLACLVPTFVVEADGTLRDAWPGPSGGPVTLPCYDSWSFRTGEQGDFQEIAVRLQATTATLLGPDFGRARIRYDRRGPGDPARARLATAGALRRPAAEAEAEALVAPWIEAEVRALADDVPTPDGRWVLTAPRYHEAFADAAAAAPGTGGWAAALAADPRGRGAAGLGAWAAIEWQEQIAAAAAIRAGDLAIARDRIGHLALGVEAARSLWRRRVPEDPVARLAVLGPVLARLPAKSGGTVREAITGRTPLLARALWSSAARRALRPGPARTARAAPGAGRFEAVLVHAATCPPPLEDPEAVPLKGGASPEAQLDAAKAAIIAATGADRALAEEVIERLLGAGVPPDPSRLAAVLAALAPGGDRRVEGQALAVALDGRGAGFDPQDLIDLSDALSAMGGRPAECRELSPAKLGEIVAAAVDPTGARPPAVDRVLGTLTGVTDIGPVEIEPELDLPLYRFLADRAADWLLPGVGDLPQDRVVALATNPPFVEALLVGANQQTLGELRWRDMPIAARWSPLRKFWQRMAGALDIAPIRTWPATEVLGAPALAAPGVEGIEAVVVFRTPLFRRYPATVVYLYEADIGWTNPQDGTPLDPAKRKPPTFTGRIEPDVTFFGFAIPPEDLATHWVVLEEPPAGYRFDSDRPVAPAATAAAFGSEAFAPPVRVMIGQLIGGGA